MDFTPLISTIAGGELPEVKVTIETRSIINLCVGVVITGVILILVWTITKNLSKNE